MQRLVLAADRFSRSRSLGGRPQPSAKLSCVASSSSTAPTQTTGWNWLGWGGGQVPTPAGEGRDSSATLGQDLHFVSVKMPHRVDGIGVRRSPSGLSAADLAEEHATLAAIFREAPQWPGPQSKGPSVEPD